MNKIFLLLSLLSAAAQAEVISPSSVEVKFAFSSEFQTAEKGTAHDLVLEQAKYLFGYMQNPDISQMFGLDKNLEGIGAPRWEPNVEVTADSQTGALRTIRYEMNGLLLLNKTVAEKLLKSGSWDISLPYDLDHFFDVSCADPDYQDPSEFWYFNFPFHAGCEKLRQAPLAHPVNMRISPAPKVDTEQKVGLSTLRGNDVFQIAAINGFNDSAKKKDDDGRANFMKMNAWFRDQGFKMTILQHFKDRPIYLFEKDLVRADGSTVHARVLRLLADTDLDGTKRVTFAKFLKQALEESDVVIYEGHSGLGVNLDLKSVEQQLLLSHDKNAGDHIEFNRSKHQIFLFDACSSYSYYLGMFAGKKDPGTLAVMSNGLESQFGYELPTTKHFYTQLMDLGHAKLPNDDLTWSELLETYERPLRGNTFMLNVDINN
ncbi:MAG: hypothetical protein ACXVCK_02670 [Bdellovibrionota bacterium]